VEGNAEHAEAIQAAYAEGAVPKRQGVSFAYMWSTDHNLGPGIDHWHLHLMVFAPYYDNSMLGQRVRQCASTSVG
jgi:hypothetical protein